MGAFIDCLVKTRVIWYPTLRKCAGAIVAPICSGKLKEVKSGTPKDPGSSEALIQSTATSSRRTPASLRCSLHRRGVCSGIMLQWAQCVLFRLGAVCWLHMVAYSQETVNRVEPVTYKEYVLGQELQ